MTDYFKKIQSNYQKKNKEIQKQVAAALLKFNGLEDFYDAYTSNDYEKISGIDYSLAINIFATDPKIAFRVYRAYYRDMILLKSIASDPETAYKYATEGGARMFPHGEPAIATSAEYSFKYAMDALKGRFELGEPAIATSAKYSCKYALFLKKRFELGEPAIAEDLEYSHLYLSKLFI